ncbi:alpha/beta hydrolase [Spirulina sp. 06S082]|uniref:alpha/beta fold hydrolase n=1 Tax=Spirulina sp. 06S082 TaxID=3110248 RepID=UPI002B1EEBE1|nr:alpha/beta hydrolase [Spirulina sp. 06S082]MEA5470391.1 alpha/beta hydrolase [Spirulina sp. 06S082]
MQLNLEIRGTGFPILCLHGHPGSSRTLSVFTDRLSQNYQTLAPDLRGYGKSPTRKEFEMQDHLEDLEELLDRHQIEKCILLGWSLGGILALELALRSPQRFTRLILVASAARPRSNHPPITWQDLAYTAVSGVINNCKPGWQWNIDTFGKRSLFRYLLCQHTPLPYKYLAAEGAIAYLQTCKTAERALQKALSAGYNRLKELEQISLPCLVLAGESDRHITAASSQETAGHLQHCQWYCYANTAHLFPWEIPQQVLNDIEDWLQEG